MIVDIMNDSRLLYLKVLYFGENAMEIVTFVKETPYTNRDLNRKENRTLHTFDPPSPILCAAKDMDHACQCPQYIPCIGL